jgi:hypothetical protein
MKKFYLVARGKINPKFVKTPDNCQSLISSTGLIDTDYMGSAEFEFGAIPKFYRRIMQRIEADNSSYAVIDLQDAIGLKTYNDQPFWAYVYMPTVIDFLEAIKSYTDDLLSRDKVREWHLKEWTGIEYHLRNDGDYTKSMARHNVWYSIDDITKTRTGDWFLTFGKQEVPYAIGKIIMKDYKNWWLNLSEEDRKKNYSDR